MNIQIKKMPKIVLHLHLDGSLRPETVRAELQRGLGSRITLEKLKELLMVEKNCRDYPGRDWEYAYY